MTKGLIRLVEEEWEENAPEAMDIDYVDVVEDFDPDEERDRVAIITKLIDKSATKSTLQAQLQSVARSFGHNTLLWDTDQRLRSSVTKTIQDETKNPISRRVFLEINDEAVEASEIVLLPNYRTSEGVIEEKVREDILEYAYNSGRLFKLDEDQENLEEAVEKSVFKIESGGVKFLEEIDDEGTRRYIFSQEHIDLFDLEEDLIALDSELDSHKNQRMKTNKHDKLVKQWLNKRLEILEADKSRIYVSEHRKNEEVFRSQAEREGLYDYLSGNLLSSRFQKVDQNKNPVGIGKGYYIFTNATELKEIKDYISANFKSESKRLEDRIRDISHIVSENYDVGLVYIDPAVEDMNSPVYKALYKQIDLAGIPVLIDGETPARGKETAKKLAELLKDPNKIAAFVATIPAESDANLLNEIHSYLTEMFDGTKKRHNPLGSPKDPKRELTSNIYLDDEGIIGNHAPLYHDIGKNTSVADFMFEQEFILKKTLYRLKGEGKDINDLSLDEVQTASKDLIEKKYSRKIRRSGESITIKTLGEYNLNRHLQAISAFKDYKKLWESEMYRIAENRNLL